MSETGLFGKWRGMYWPAPSNCSTGLIFTDVGSQPLALADLVSAFLLLALGALLATAVLLAELAYRAATPGRARGTEGLRERVQGPRERVQGLRDSGSGFKY